jgi:hypothetical protein
MLTRTAIGAIGLTTTIASAQLNLGLYEGQWDNNTFGSSGAASMLIESLGGADISITIDLDGFVFGGADPDPFVITGSVGPMGFTPDPFMSDGFGTMSGGVDENGNVAIDLADAAGGDFSLVTLRGIAMGEAVELDYEIFLANNPTAPFAVGELNMYYVPSPGGMALFGIGGLLIARRKR